MNRIAPLAALALLSLTVLTGCGKESGNPLAPNATGSTESSASDFAAERARTDDRDDSGGSRSGVSRVLFVHASPDAPAVDILLDRKRVARGLRFPDNTTYRYAWSGERRVRVNVARTSNSVIDASVTLDPRTFYSVFATGVVADLQPVVLVDDLTKPARGKAHVRFVHLSPDAPAVDVAVAGGPVVFGNKSFRESTPFTPLDAGTYNLEVRVAGTTTVALPLPGVRLEDGKIYTVFARGLLSGTGAQALGAQVIVNSNVRGSWKPNDDDDDDDRNDD